MQARVIAVSLAVLQGTAALRMGPAALPPRAVDACAAPAFLPARPAPSGRAAFSAIVMQQPTPDTFFDEYVQTDPETGERTSISLDEKEKLYLECLDAFYNEGKQVCACV